MSKSTSTEAPYTKVATSLMERVLILGLSKVAWRVYGFLRSSPEMRRHPGIFPGNARLISASIPTLRLSQVKAGLDQLSEVGLIVHDERMVWIPDAWLDNVPPTPNEVVRLVKDLKAVRVDGSPVGLEAVASMITSLRSRGDARYTHELEAAFPASARLAASRTRPVAETPVKERFTAINVSFPNDERVRTLSLEGYWLYSFFLLCPEAAKLPGLFRGAAEALATRIPLTEREVRRGLGELERVRLIVRDERLVWLPNTWRYNPPTSSDHVSSLVRELKSLCADSSPVGKQALAALHTHLRARKDPQFWLRFEATFPDIAALAESGVLTGVFVQPLRSASISASPAASAEPAAARAMLGSSDPDPGAFGEPDPLEEAAPAPRVDEGPPPDGERPKAREELLERLEELGRRAWAGYRHLRPSAPFTAAQRAALEAFVALDAPDRAEARVLDLCRRAGEAAFLALPVGDGPRARRIDPTLGELLERGDWRAALLEGRWARGPGLRVLEPRSSATWETSQNPGIVEARRKQASAQRPPARLDGEVLKRTMAAAHAELPDGLRREVCG